MVDNAANFVRVRCGRPRARRHRRDCPPRRRRTAPLARHEAATWLDLARPCSSARSAATTTARPIRPLALHVDGLTDSPTASPACTGGSSARLLAGLPCSTATCRSYRRPHSPDAGLAPEKAGINLEGIGDGDGASSPASATGAGGPVAGQASTRRRCSRCRAGFEALVRLTSAARHPQQEWPAADAISSPARPATVASLRHIPLERKRRP
jgi:hypothetical protein